jgi:hypothetical protein
MKGSISMKRYGLALLICLHALPASADESAADLAKTASDPTAALTSINLKYSVTGLQDYGQDIHAVQFQPAIPFKAFGVSNILRSTVTFETDGPSGARLADVTIFDLAVFDKSWGRWGVGPVMQLRGGKNPGPFAIGPAVGFVSGKGRWTYGLFNQNLFGGGTSISSIQPVIAYQLGDGWALSSGDAQITMDWDRNRLVNLPVGVQLSKVTKIGGQAVKFSINPEYNLLKVSGAPDFSIRAGFSVLVPAG